MTKRLRVGLVVAGLLGLYVYLRFLANDGHTISFTPPFGPPNFLYVSEGESRFLLLHTLVALPSVVAIIVGWSERLGQAAMTRLDRYARSDPKQFRTLSIAFTLLLFSLYRVGRSLVLRDLPVTDDENAIEYGARILAAGRLTAPALAPDGAFLELFLHTKDGLATSFDWPGGLMFRALAIKTGLGDYLYALFAAIAGTAVVGTVHRVLGARSGFLAAIAFLCSPLAIGLSLTAHAHIVARAFIAVAIYLYVGEATPRRGALFGAMVAGALLTRPFEATALLGPLLVHCLWRARVDELGWRRFVAAAAVLLAVGAAVFAWYNAGTTGNALLPARFDRVHIDANFLPPMSIDERVAAHVAHNLPLLAVYVLGAAGLPVAAIGMLTGPRPLFFIGLGFVASLFLMLGHSNVGMHTIGPIHYSESVVPLVVLFVAGVEKIAELLPRATVYAVMLGYAVVGLGGLFIAPWMMQLARHGAFVARPYDFLAEKQVTNAIVLCPQLPAMRPPGAPGTWQLNMPHPDPFLEEDVVCALPTANPDALHATYPTRHIWRLTAGPGGALGLQHVYAPQ